MTKAFAIGAALLLALSCAGCSAARPQQPPLPVVTARTATMDVTPGLKLLARIELPDGFTPSPSYPPMWLQSGKEIGVAGTVQGRSMVVGYSGAAWGTERILAQDGGAGIKDGHIVDVAPSPDGMTLALAVADSHDKRVEVVVRDVIAAGDGHPVSTFGGDFDGASVGWVDQFTIALALRRRETTVTAATADGRGAPPAAAQASSGLYLIAINGMVTADFLDLKCKLSRLSWSPSGEFAVGSGDETAPPLLIDRRKNSCELLNAQAPIRVLDWTRDGKSFLYEETDRDGQTAAYRYDVVKRSGRLVAVSSGAVTFMPDGDVLALGNSSLSFQRIRLRPQQPAMAQLALINSKDAEVDVQSLGFKATPEMLAQSTMVYSKASNSAAIATFGLTPAGPLRRVLTYSASDKNAFLIAFGPPRGPVLLNWSPRGQYLAIVDGDAVESALTILSPPRYSQ
jgi:hypothetical protein